MTNVNYVENLKASQKVARDILRSKKISNLLGFIKNLKDEIAESIKERKEIVEANEVSNRNFELDIAMQEYQIRIAVNNGHPELERISELANKFIEKNKVDMAKSNANLESYLVAFDAGFVLTTNAIEEKIKGYEAKIAAWENGESKVNYEEMVEIAVSLEANRLKGDYAHTIHVVAS